MRVSREFFLVGCFVEFIILENSPVATCRHPRVGAGEARSGSARNRCKSKCSRKKDECAPSFVTKGTRVGHSGDEPVKLRVASKHISKEIRHRGVVTTKKESCGRLARHDLHRTPWAREKCAEIHVVFHHDVAYTVVRGKLKDGASYRATSRHGGTPWKLHALYVDDIVPIEHNSDDATCASTSDQDRTHSLSEQFTLPIEKSRHHERRHGGLRRCVSNEQRLEEK